MKVIRSWTPKAFPSQNRVEDYALGTVVIITGMTECVYLVVNAGHGRVGINLESGHHVGGNATVIQVLSAELRVTPILGESE